MATSGSWKSQKMLQGYQTKRGGVTASPFWSSETTSCHRRRIKMPSVLLFSASGIATDGPPQGPPNNSPKRKHIQPEGEKVTFFFALQLPESHHGPFKSKKVILPPPLFSLFHTTGREHFLPPGSFPPPGTNMNGSQSPAPSSVSILATTKTSTSTLSGWAGDHSAFLRSPPPPTSDQGQRPPLSPGVMQPGGSQVAPHLCDKPPVLTEPTRLPKLFFQISKAKPGERAFGFETLDMRHIRERTVRRLRDTLENHAFKVWEKDPRKKPDTPNCHQSPPTKTSSASTHSTGEGT